MRQVIIYILIVSSTSMVCLYARSQGRMTRDGYIEAYSEYAIKEMERSGVPASITLAQGMLESDNGNSRLATEANNHFGIKCHDDWKGKTIKHNDDRRKECFRKYNSPLESYEDHSDFLRDGSRYDELFKLDPLDYKAWARGLKRTGYATSNTYASKLIKIIEENDLHKYDLIAGPVAETAGKQVKTFAKPYTSASRIIYYRNRIKYITVKEGDTYESIQKELELMPFELFKYNDLTRDSVLYPGRELYIQPKRNQAEAGKSYHIVTEGEKLHTISQMYGVKPDQIMKMNMMSVDTGLVAGQKLVLRKKVAGRQGKPVKQVIQPETEKEKDKTKFKTVKKIKEKVKDKEEETMEFEFNQ